MSYLAFARKYRPQRFSEVIGQHAVVKTLQNALSGSRLHHSYLITGARGIGKTTIARILAKAMNCEKGPAAEPCCECQSCKDIASGNSLAVQEIDGASNTSVDDVRQIREQVKYIAAGGRYKVYIIDEVHMLSTAAFNALLKTLEEPPPHVVFMFATTEPGKIPATILSRCQRYDLRRLSTSLISDSLRTIATNESINMDDDALQLIASEADGSLRDAQSLFDQAIAYCGHEVNIEPVEEMLGATDRSTIYAIADHLSEKDVQSALTKLDAAYERGADLMRLSSDLLSVYRHLLVIAACKGERVPIDLPTADIEKLSVLAKKRDLTSWQQCFNIVYNTCSEIARSPLPRAALEAGIIRLSQVDDVTPLAEILSELGTGDFSNAAPKKTLNKTVPTNTNVESSLPGSTITPQTQTRPKTPISKSTSASSPASRWNEFNTWLNEKNKPRLSAVLSHGKMKDSPDGSVKLIFESPFHAAMLGEKDRKDEFEALLKEFYGTKLKYVVGHDKNDDAVNVTGASAQTGETSEAVRNAKEILGAALQDVKRR